MIPHKLKGVQLEKHVLDSLKKQDGITGGKYGVKMSFQNDEYRPVKSYPDIEGVLAPTGRQWIAECKVCSGPSLYLASRIRIKKQNRQLDHLLERGVHGAVTFYLVHFNHRTLVKSEQQPVTYGMPVHPGHPYWRRFGCGDEKSFNRDILDKYGFRAEWIVPPRCRKPVMDMLTLVNTIAEVIDDFME